MLTNQSLPLISFLFHKLGAPSHVGDVYAVPGAWLERLIAQAAQHGYTFARWDQLDTALTQAYRGVVTITFDDGYASDLTEALPLLQAHAIPATCFIVPAWIGQPGYLTWADVRTLAAANVAIGSHTQSHGWLPELSDTALRNELVAGRQTLEDQLGAPVRLLSLPGGFYNRRVIKAAIKAGYTIIGTSNLGIDRQIVGRSDRVRLLKRNCLDLRTPWHMVDSLLRLQTPTRLLVQSQAKRLLAQMIGPSRYRLLARSRRNRKRHHGST